MKRYYLIFIYALFCSFAIAQNDTITVKTSEKQAANNGKSNYVYEKVKDFNKVDTSYIEPQHYNFTVMLQNTNTYDLYTIESKNGYSMVFAPELTVKIGPYFGWRWIFAGYTFDIGHLSNNSKKEFDISIYSSKIGIDLFYRKTGEDYKIRDIDLGKDINTKSLNGMPFGGLSVGIKGFNAYYIFNHHKFSYPAAFSQSTRQKRSCGSPLIGLGYTRHVLGFDYNKLQSLIKEKIPEYEQQIDSGLMFSKIRYTDISLSGGYAYNYVFSKNWLLAISLSLAIGYKHSSGDLQHNGFRFRDFSFSNISLDGVGRFGIVWNNDKWYAGSSAILHSYNYNKPQFSTSNLFGSINIYVGFNFGRRKMKEK